MPVQRLLGCLAKVPRAIRTPLQQLEDDLRRTVNPSFAYLASCSNMAEALIHHPGRHLGAGSAYTEVVMKNFKKTWAIAEAEESLDQKSAAMITPAPPLHPNFLCIWRQQQSPSLRPCP
ncbi:hypothetical protein NMY22_g17280 [Coprinellus aureogranulatus]|nr:hypothetical protein NMY22_g17280 [Coprinellus aureogranulatus]